MRPIVLNDGTFIHNENMLREYLEPLGFDLEDLKYFLCEEELSELEELKEDRKTYERVVDSYFCDARDLALAVDEVCDTYRKKYKSAAVIKVLDAIQTCVAENRID